MQNHPRFVGFPSCEDRGIPLELYKWFKKDFPSNLSSNNRDAGRFWQRPSDATETYVLYLNFLTTLYTSIESALTSPLEIQRNGLNWNEAQIQFVFSVPATWNRPHETLGMVADSLETVAKEAGFEGANRAVKIGMTEPEAAAAYALAMNQDLIHDLCLLKMEQTGDRRFEIDPLSAPVGEDLGATHVDRGFEDLAEKKLRRIHYDAGIQREWNFKKMAQRMAESGEFQTSKKELNLAKAGSDQVFGVPLPYLDSNNIPEHAEVTSGSVRFTWSELAKIFDTIIQDREVIRGGRPETLPGLNKLIQRVREGLRYRSNDHVGSLSSNSPADVSVILMSGGLSQSDYITQRIAEYLSTQVDTFGPAPEVRTITDPQLCVCRGLLTDSLYSIFRTQKCNGNYGILDYIPYRSYKISHRIAKRGNHVKEMGGTRYVEEIKWLIQKNEKVPELPIRSICFLQQFRENDERPHITLIVSEDSKALDYPSHGKTYDFLCKIEFDTPPDYNARERKFYCEVELIFSVASLRVNCWSPSEPGNRKLVGKYNGEYTQLTYQGR
ncbi:hypothetical protein LX36DRAFT_716614 [Colletotrichum falcatum]|nr:hypothetical protein LX36DRAFT_716614 [Colletotrichum falcatum]